MSTAEHKRGRRWITRHWLPAAGWLMATSFGPGSLQAQLPSPGQSPSQTQHGVIEDYNRRIKELRKLSSARGEITSAEEYRIGPEDLLEVTVFEAPELNRSVRVSAGGAISLPLLGAVPCAGLTPRELEVVLEQLFRSYLKDPHVSVFVRELESHLVSVVGAVKKPGVFRLRGSKTVLEMLSLAEGLAEDAGDTVVVMRHTGRPAAAPTGTPEGIEAASVRTKSASGVGSPNPTSVEINLKILLESGDPSLNVPVYPGDIVKVLRAGIVYVVGEVRKPGGFVLKSNENITVLQALALAEGLTRTSAKSRTRIIRTDEATGQRTEVAVNLGEILAGRAPDPLLRARDIVFVPNSSGRSALYRSTEAALSILTGVIIFRR